MPTDVQEKIDACAAHANKFRDQESHMIKLCQKLDGTDQKALAAGMSYSSGLAPIAQFVLVHEFVHFLRVFAESLKLGEETAVGYFLEALRNFSLVAI